MNETAYNLASLQPPFIVLSILYKKGGHCVVGEEIQTQIQKLMR